jgi:mono/diheme cytochrome c family protein
MKSFTLIIMVIGYATFFVSCVNDENEQLTPYEVADVLKGGIMYDKFWCIEAAYNQNSALLYRINAFSEFFTCKQCHGWDGLGNGGSFINREPKITRPNISGLNLYKLAKSSTEQELFDGIKKTTGRRDISFDLTSYNPNVNAAEGDKMPNFTQLLTDSQIWDIVKFLKEGMFNVDILYAGTYTGVYPTGTATFSNIGRNGIETNGNVFYSANCAHCHGSNGKTMSIEGMSLGKFVRSKPNEVQHKIKYGQPGAIMEGESKITISQMKDLFKAFSNTETYPD